VWSPKTMDPVSPAGTTAASTRSPHLTGTPSQTCRTWPIMACTAAPSSARSTWSKNTTRYPSPPPTYQTAIITPFGLFEPQERCSNFQRTIDQKRRDLKFLFTYFDDSRISSKTAAEHLEHLDQFFAVLAANASPSTSASALSWCLS
jgi:hypothetical protein